MKFGAMIATHVDDWRLLQHAESLGYDHGWVPDSQMIWSDCYAVLALAAASTSRIRLGTGVAIAPTRIAPVTAHSIATIARLAPGRVFLGIGTGHTAMRVMGMRPMPPKEFAEYLRVVRGLLAGEEVEYTLRGETRAIRFLHRDRRFIELERPIPIWVAANGPGALRATGAYGDGRISALYEPPELARSSLGLIAEGAAKAGRSLPEPFHTAALTTAVVLHPGEKLTSERVIDECGSQVAAALHYCWEVHQQSGSADHLPPPVRPLYDEYCAYVEKMETPREKRYLQVHEGHCSFLVPEERRFVTPDAIRTWCLVGEPDDLIHQIRAAESAGLREVTLLPPMDRARKVFQDFAKHVIERY
ncbi:MAG TPA: LLM class flavin-dependent oxidoreductase [Myxococcota bacterium]|jgi:alkanesulfonate monooxygenase SsuD/methylene tetrahydromethanopterin reductase-like flavin-dependent oxidoreductase (luciferase family)|nr:LLM class flavin-dependent oxidoreductase [Myxococcota bacterium]